MPDVASVLKQEITRLARKEVAARTARQSKQIKGLKDTVRDLKQQVAALTQAVSRLSKVTSPQLSPPEPPEDLASVRITPGSIRKHRKRLGLSQTEMGQLLKVVRITIARWEAGKARPRGESRAAVAQLRGMGVREARALLESMKGC